MKLFPEVHKLRTHPTPVQEQRTTQLSKHFVFAERQMGNIRVSISTEHWMMTWEHTHHIPIYFWLTVVTHGVEFCQCCPTFRISRRSSDSTVGWHSTTLFSWNYRNLLSIRSMVDTRNSYKILIVSLKEIYDWHTYAYARG
jgi:hypothetical protein